jgi:predicted metal-dependent phosphoesterase TrpH
MQEIVTNLHIHTRYSDGHANHEEIARAALSCGVDVIIITDHNVLVNGMERYYDEGKQRVLLLVGRRCTTSLACLKKATCW